MILQLDDYRNARAVSDAEEFAARLELAVRKRDTHVRLHLPAVRDGRLFGVDNIASFRACARMGR